VPEDGLAELLASWEIALRAEGKSKDTVKSYGDGMRSYMRWAQHAGAAGFTRDNVTAFLAYLMETGSATTAGIRAKSLKLLSTWAHDEGRLDADVLAGLKPPRPDKTVVPKLTDDELKRLIAACAADKSLYARRDEAIVRLASEAGCRAEELLGMDLPDDLDLRRGIAVIRRGKGAKGRIVPFGSQTARAIDRYVFMRRKAGHPDKGALWPSQRKGRLGYHGLYATLVKRAEVAGIPDFHPHRLRHMFASRWLAAGGSEGGLMAVAGWTSREMLDRYVADTRSEMAAEESRRLGLGDV
jgi:site-specific recombinase XerD